MKFKKGEMAVYPGDGVGAIKKIEKRVFSGKREEFYVLRILDTETTILIPVKNVKQVGLRKVINTKEVEEIYRILRKRKANSNNQPWNRRYRHYMEKLKSGSLRDIAEVLRNLSLLKNDKALSFGERRMFDTARSLLVKEISIAKKVSEDYVEKDISRYINF